MNSAGTASGSSRNERISEMKRKPYVAGQFYPGKAEELRDMIAGLIDPGASKDKAIAVMSPHAGYIYSGPVAGAVYSSIELPETFVVLGPAHRPIASVFAVQGEGAWSTPLGEASIAADLAAAIRSHSPLIEENAADHRMEHSLEVQIPFLQYFRPGASIVPICVSWEAGFRDLEELGGALAAGIRSHPREVLIVASTDMSHYVSRETARAMDESAIDRVLALDARGLYETVRRKNISMCGFKPVAAALVAAKSLGARKGVLVRYGTSGDATGDDREVVGYAGIKIL